MLNVIKTPDWYKQQLRSLAIQVGGAVFHILLWNQASLETTWRLYMGEKWKDGSYPDISFNPMKLSTDIWILEERWRWIIIMNHDSWIFPDYLPIFGLVSDDILTKTTFYTWPYNLAMNRARFPWYHFESTVENDNFKDKKTLLEKVKTTTANLSAEWGYIFLMPAGAGKDDGGKPFQAIFSHIIKGLNGDTPVLAIHVEHKGEVSYGSVLRKHFRQRSFKTNIASEMTYVKDWPQTSWPEQRRYYNQLFKIPTIR